MSTVIIFLFFIGLAILVGWGLIEGWKDKGMREEFREFLRNNKKET